MRRLSGAFEILPANLLPLKSQMEDHLREPSPRFCSH